MTTKITEKNISSLANAGVSWQSVIVADGSTITTGVAGRGYFIDTTSFTHSFNLPSSATAGDTIIVKDYAKTFDTNKLTVSGNGNNIEGANVVADITTEGQSTTFVYIDATKGWLISNEGKSGNIIQSLFISATGGTITTSGDFKIHSFTGDGCFAVSQLGNSPTVPTGGPTNVDYLVVAGGGAGGFQKAGGGGAGGHRTSFPSPGCNAGSFPITATTYPITVGGGGARASNSGLASTGNGTPSVFSTITSTGGGGGGSDLSNAGQAGAPGGSGGGASRGPGGGSGNTPPTSPSQGNNGGAGENVHSQYNAGGGGGIGGVGGTATPTASGAGGAGTSNSITGSSVTRAGGGGSIGYAAGGSTGSAGGSGVGGAGGTAGCVSGTSGTINTGSGGGGSDQAAGGAGGSGIVVIRYKFQ